jgi:hypothetical protein
VLAETLYYEATCAMYAGDKTGAAAGFRECLAVCKELVKQTDPKGMQYNLMLALGRCGEHVEAARIAHSLVATPPKDENLYVQAALGYAVASAATGDDMQAKERYTTEALECLRQAKKRGWSDIETLKHDTDLEPIRNDPGFHALLKEFENQKKVPGTLK